MVIIINDMKKTTLNIFAAFVFIAIVIALIMPLRSNLATIEGILPLISNGGTIGFITYKPTVTSFDVPVSDDFLSILQADKWERSTGRWNRDTVSWENAIVILIMDGLRIYIENDTAVTYYEYAIPVIERRYTLYSIPLEASEKLLAYVLEN